MAATHRAPKQWCLSKAETVNTFESWRQNLIYTLALDENFAPLLVDGVTWQKKTRTAPLRGFTDDGVDIPAARRKTAQQKVNILDLMLGQIANYCPIISRNTIVRNSTSVSQLWQTIRLHYGFESTGAHFLDLAEIHQEPEERPEDLYQRLMAFTEDNLLRRGGGITHHGEAITEDEEMSPTLENIVVLTWLRLIHKDLPKLVKQRYGTELRSRSLASIKPEISLSINTLLDEIRNGEDARIMRTSATSFNSRLNNRTQHHQFRTKTTKLGNKPFKQCPLCKEAGRTDQHHYLSECRFLPESDRKFMTKVRYITDIFDTEETNDLEESILDQTPTSELSDLGPPVALRVQVRQSPYLDTFCGHHAVRITIDSGATGNMIRASTALMLGAQVNKTSQSAHQADGSSPLQFIGETQVTLVRDSNRFLLEALVVEDLDVSILAGTPFMEHNDITIRPAKRQVILHNGTTFTHGSKPCVGDQHKIRRTIVLRSPGQQTTVWPGEFLEIELPPELEEDSIPLAVEPHITFQARNISIGPRQWPSPTIINSVAGKIRIPNLTSEAVVLKRHEHFGQASTVYEPVNDKTFQKSLKCTKVRTSTVTPESTLSLLQIDPDNILPQDVRNEFHKLHEKHIQVFNTKFEGYNGASGPFKAHVNLGPVQPPQRKGRVPQYAKDKLVELQDKLDELESLGVIRRPEDVGVCVEYLNPSFLVKKPKGGYRLVTAFAEVGKYSKPQPSLLPDVDSTLRQIGQWRYIIASDLASAYYQIPLSHDSLKYCGIVTPFKGVRVYVRSAMGMPGSETALEELMCRVLGDLVKEGIVTKLADDLYCGGNTPQELLQNWSLVLQLLQHNNLCLSAHKTVIAPKTTTILGWKWSLGTLQATQHRLSTLASCSPPDNVKGLRSFIGAYKVLSRVIPGCSTYLSILEDTVAGQESKDKIQWTESLIESFNKAQKALKLQRPISIPHPNDQLWIITDGSVKQRGIGATLYIMRKGSLQLAGFFSAKLRKQQVTWLPCEIEALSIAASIKHFSPYIVQSKHSTCILTDSKPCVQAYEKLCRGEFSASPRVSTFLTIVSRYQATVRHIAGVANLPSDHASRNAPECTDESCQICGFIHIMEESVVRSLSVQDITTGKIHLPYTSKTAWLTIQNECQDADTSISGRY